MSETTLVKAILVEVSKLPGVRVWRQNTGVAYGLDALDQMIKGRAARPITFGVPGAADITGLGPGGRRIEIEVKRGGKNRYGQTKQQKAYQEMIRGLGGVYILTTSPHDAVKRLKEEFEIDCKPDRCIAPGGTRGGGAGVFDYPDAAEQAPRSGLMEGPSAEEG